MKKFLFPLFCAASFALTGCQQEVKSAKVKEKLEKNGYKVSLKSAEETKADYSAFTYNVEIKDSIFVTKGDNIEPKLLAFFCVNIEAANKFLEDNIAQLTAVGEKYGADRNPGCHNNVAFVGVGEVIDLAGLSVK